MGIILLPTDGLPASFAAEKYALELAKKSGSRIRALYIVEKPKRTLHSHMVMEPVLRHAQRRAEKAVEKVKKMGDDAGVEVEVEVLEGDPVHVIEDYIKKHYRDIDTVVMGSGRKSRLERLLSGSISKKVIERVAEDVYCPIMIVTQE